MFALHPRLIEDTLPICRLPVCLALLMNDRRYPWVILVPALPEISEIHQLTKDVQHQLMDEIALASAALTEVFEPDKINVAALGNVVPQLHVHVIARFRGDAAWPAPVWGRGEAEACDADALRTTARLLALRLAANG